jgi:actin-related protein 6
MIVSLIKTLPGPTFNAYRDVQSMLRTSGMPSAVPPPTLPAEVLLLIDCGYSHTTVTPILAGRPLHPAIRRLDVGGKLMTNYLTRLLSLRHFDLRNDTHIVNDIKEAACYVSQDFEADLDTCWKGPRGDRRERYTTGGGIAKDYILPDFHTRPKGVLVEYDPARHALGKKLAGGDEQDRITLRNERFVVPEILFNPSDVGIKQPGLADVVMQSVCSLPLGLWPGLLYNVVVVGGCARLPGFVERLQKEIVQRAPDECLVRVGPTKETDPILGTWFGGANLARHEHIERLVVTKQEYDEHGSAWVARKFSGGLGSA